MAAVIIPGPEGRLEGKYQQINNANGIALLLHPHPEFGGSMNNKPMISLFNLFVEKQFSTVRFNFRGVGNSQGQHDGQEGELCDSASVLDWIQSLNTGTTECWICGLSFGAWIGMQLLMRRPEITRFVSIAPPAGKYDFSFLAPCPTSGIMVLGSKDTEIVQDSVPSLVKKISNDRPIDVEFAKIKNADHFFRNKENALCKKVGEYIDYVGSIEE